MNNRGFAITTILFGLLILFMLLFVSLLGILSTYRSNLEKLVENTNGAREKVTLKKTSVDSFDLVTKRGLYCVSNDDCSYIGSSDNTQIYTYNNIPNNGSVYYGPYLAMSSGKWQIDIYGTNLTKCDYTSYDCNGDGTCPNRTNFTLTPIQGSGDNHYALNIEIASDTPSLEVIISSPSKCTITKEEFRKVE